MEQMQEFLSEDPFISGRLAIARLTSSEMSAETLLQWLQRAASGSFGRLARQVLMFHDVSSGCAQFPWIQDWDHFHPNPGHPCS